MIKARSLRWPFAGLVAVILLGLTLNDFGLIGISASSSERAFSIAGSTEPWALALAALIILLYLVLIYSEPSDNRTPMPGLPRRWVALGIDFLIAMMAASPIAGLLAVVFEWRRVGVFQWTFERSTAAPGDSLLLLIESLVGGLILVFYFSLPIIRRRPSPGACIMGYQIVPDEGTSFGLGRAIQRTLLGFIAACVWFLAFIGRDRRRGKFWLDKVFATRAVLL
ncbi:MAG TPA: RDD family protein [Candidatus Angelobacter sp.]|nr:RDD family protein [Candidatus Angelobacter sp.]